MMIKLKGAPITLSIFRVAGFILLSIITVGLWSWNVSASDGCPDGMEPVARQTSVDVLVLDPTTKIVFLKPIVIPRGERGIRISRSEVNPVTERVEYFFLRDEGESIDHNRIVKAGIPRSITRFDDYGYGQVDSGIVFGRLKIGHAGRTIQWRFPVGDLIDELEDLLTFCVALTPNEEI